MKRLWDISPPVQPGSPVFPGDAAFELRWGATLSAYCPVNVSTLEKQTPGRPTCFSSPSGRRTPQGGGLGGALRLSPHTGAHADAPLHYSADDATVGPRDLAPFLGRCRVVHAIDCGPLIEGRHLAHAPGDALAAAPDTLPPRLLVRTHARAATGWDPQLAGYAPDTFERLAKAGVRLVGIDTASIDPADSKALPSHRVIRRRGLPVLENLLLDDVPDGDYELIALPLKLMTADASPVRAMLREL